jgi:hypothetical protein
MAGSKRRMFLPQPEELRRNYGENATAAASVMGSLRPAVFAVFAVMLVAVIVITALAGGDGPGFPGWAVALIVLDVAAACVIITAVILRKAKRVALLKPRRG